MLFLLSVQTGLKMNGRASQELKWQSIANASQTVDEKKSICRYYFYKMKLLLRGF